MMKRVLIIFLFPMVSWGQGLDLKNLVSKIPSANDSLERMANMGQLTNMIYNDSIEVKIVQCRLNGVSYFKMVGNWSNSNYDQHSIFINVNNYILALPVNDAKYYSKVFTFDIVSSSFIPLYTLTIDNDQIKLITCYRSINENFYSLDNHYVRSDYSMNNSFYFDISKLHEAINKGEIYSLGSSTISKTEYIKEFLSYRWW